jgi:hypothetical protein
MALNPTTLFLCLLASAASWSSLLSPAAAADAMEWQFFQADDPGYKTTRLVYGVPETDNVQVSGACVHSSSVGANFSIVTFGADIGDLESGKDTELRLSGGGFDHTLKGKIIRATGEEGLNGVEVDVGNDDPLWRAFAEKDSLDYLVPGYKAASLDFSRGRDKIQQFVKACETFADATPPAQSGAASGGDAEKEAFENAKDLGTVEAWEAFIANYPSGFHADLARAYIKKLGDAAPAAAPSADEGPIPNVSASREVPDPPCRNRKNIRSMVSEEKTKLTFINRSGSTRNIMWLDFGSNARSYGRLKNGEQIELDTFMTHPWMVTNSGGACLQIVEPDSGGRVVVLEGSGEQPAEQPAAKKATTKSKKFGCSKGQITVEGKCMSKSQAVGYCGPGFHPQGGKCVQGFVAPKGPRPSTHGCPPGMAWSKEEGCHEDD